MTPGARLQAAIEILEQSFAAPLSADAVADAYFRRRRYAGAGDRRAVQERVFNMLRRKARLAWNIARAGVELDAHVTPSGVHSHDAPLPAVPPSPRALALADLIVGDGLDANDAGRLFASSRHAPAPLTDVERALARALEGSAVVRSPCEGTPNGVTCEGTPNGVTCEGTPDGVTREGTPDGVTRASPRLDDPAMPDPVRHEYPVWLEPSLRVAFGDRLAEEMSALNHQAPLDLRVNAIKGTRDAARSALAAESVAADPTPLSPWGLRVKGAVRIGGTRAFKQGLVEVQDEGSQIVAALVGAGPGMTVVDFCAGAGGKTLALAAAMTRPADLRAAQASRHTRIEGRLIACDTSRTRLGRMTARLARAGAESVRRLVLADENDPALGEFAGAADRVLLDVPCSASGVWRRDPLGKWRLTPEQLDRLVASQRRILAAAARLVRPGGRLVYATCSVLPEENEAQVAFFLDRYDEFEAVPMARIWGETLPGTLPAPDPHLRLTPAACGTDGFFAAVLERRSPRG